MTVQLTATKMMADVYFTRMHCGQESFNIKNQIKVCWRTSIRENVLFLVLLGKSEPLSCDVLYTCKICKNSTSTSSLNFLYLVNSSNRLWSQNIFTVTFLIGRGDWNKEQDKEILKILYDILYAVNADRSLHSDDLF